MGRALDRFFDVWAANTSAGVAVVFVACLASSTAPGDAAVIAACSGGPVSLGVGALGAFMWVVTRSAPTGAKVMLRSAPLGLFAALCAYLAFGALSPREAAGCLTGDEPPPGLVVRADRRGGFAEGWWYASLFELPREQAEALLPAFEDVGWDPQGDGAYLAPTVVRDLGAPPVQVWHLREEGPWNDAILIGRTSTPDLYVGLCYYRR